VYAFLARPIGDALVHPHVDYATGLDGERLAGGTNPAGTMQVWFG
jgi:hypothetical protein